MQRLNEERGAIAVIVALSMIMMFGFAALVIDVGALYQERRELQNGADAAALAIAAECVEEVLACIAGAAVELELAVGRSYADENALDDTTEVDSVVFGAQKVTVTTSTKVPGGGTEILYKLAGVLPGDYVGDTVGAAATATWGTPSSLDVFPLAFSLCEFTNAMPFGTPKPLIIKTDPDPAGVCGPTVNAPGAWGYLGGFGCVAHIDAGTAYTDGGANAPNCSAQAFEDLYFEKVVYVPIYDTVSGQGDNVEYTILGFAAYRLDAYDFNNGPEWERGDPACATQSTECLEGSFVEYVAYADVGTSASLGVTAISLSA